MFGRQVNAGGAARATKRPDSRQNKMWVEKYRPQKIDDVAHQDEIVTALKHGLRTGDIPHLLLYGPAGVGKTTTALAICKQLYGPELYSDRVLEMNASDDRGIYTVRNKIKRFAGFASSAESAEIRAYREAGYPCPAWKVIILDECDSMTIDAQSALRRVIEQFSTSTRFILICNYISRIIEPIVSRCVKFRFKSLSGDVMRRRLQYILEAENLKLSNQPAVLECLMKISGGDLRKAITLLQSSVTFYGDSLETGHLIEIAGIIPDIHIQGLMQRCKSNDFSSVQQGIDEIVNNGYSAHQAKIKTIQQLFEHCLLDVQLAEAQKAQLLLKFGAVDTRIVQGAQEELQLMDLCASIMKMSNL